MLPSYPISHICVPFQTQDYEDFSAEENIINSNDYSNDYSLGHVNGKNVRGCLYIS